MLAEDRPKNRESLSQASPPIVTVGPLVLPPPVITWELLPADFILPDDPVDNIHQPSIATVDGTTIAKAPDWAYIAEITVPIEAVNRSYTPHLQGEVPTIVLEFLSETDGTEYSIKPDKPMGKWYYYERVLKVPYYGIFEPLSGDIQMYVLGESGCYNRLPIEESGRYWIPPMNLAIAAWKGKRQSRSIYWLRWWDAEGNLLPWATEKVDQERQRADTESQWAEAESQRADRLIAQLKALGIDPEGSAVT